MNNILADQLQVWGFEDDFVIFSDGSLGFGVEVSPVDVSCWEGERVNGLADRCAQFLNGLPSGIDLQFVQEVGRGNADLVKTHRSLGINAANPIAQTLCEARTKRLLDYETQGLIPKHSLKVFVRRPLTGALFQRPKIFAKQSLFEPMIEEKLAVELNAARRLRDDISEGLKSLDLEISYLDSKTILDLIYWQWNPTRPVGRAEYDPSDVRSSLIFTDASIYESGFSLSEMHHRVISLKILPDETFASMARKLRELPFDSRCFLTIQVTDQQKEISSLQTQRRLAFSMARGKKEGVSDIESEAKFQDLETLLEQMIAQGEKVFHVSLNVLLRSRDKYELENQVSLTLMKLRELGGAEGMEESLAAFDIFSELALPNARAKERSKRVKTSNLTDLLPIYGPWRGHEKPSILLRSRMGSLISFDPFSKDLTNYNHIVSGGSGSGKSFMTNILLLQILKEDPKIFIVDIGGSYRKLCDNLSGQNISLGVDTGIAINPFDLLPGESAPSSHKIKFLVGLVELMTREEGETRLRRLERAEIEEAIQQVYEKSTTPRISVLREILLNHSNTEMRRFGRILTPWCGETPFGQFVDRPTTISLEKPLVAFDLKGMETYPDLQAVALFIITDFVWREVQRDRSQKKFLILDECWKLLENDAGAAFIGEVFRTFRKYYAGAIAISQNVDDFAKSKVSGAILTNSAVKWILMQKGADQLRLKEVLQLNDTEMQLIASLHQERGLFSEVFLMAQDQRSVVAVEPTPLEYWIATTDPRDLGAVEAASKENPEASPIKILTTLSEQYPRGMVASQ
jgi:conjugal transfer ATP-binding protein TraC